MELLLAWAELRLAKEESMNRGTAAGMGLVAVAMVSRRP
jgi:hypothetical protein